MSESARLPKADQHPLLADRARLETIADNMYAQIHRTMRKGSGRRSDRGVEKAVAGGESADDAVQEALLALLCYDPARLTRSWEALSVTIAKHKAIEALRSATRGRRLMGAADDAPDKIALVPLSDADLDRLAATDGSDPEEEFVKVQQQLVLVRLARQLPHRDRTIFLGIHFEGLSRADLGRQLGLSGQGVGQIYQKTAERLLLSARNDPAYPTIDPNWKEDQ